jgi:L-threonylcarbamoyladenylate synthase
VRDDLGEAVDLVLDGGPCTVGVESTIVDLTVSPPSVLRPGGIPLEALEAIVDGPVRGEDTGPRRAPGMLASHYAPEAALRLAAAEVRPGEALLAFGSRLPPGADRATAIRNLSEAGDLTEAASNLFAALRELDGRSAAIAVMPIPDEGLGEAINDRLRRAAAPVKGI